MNDNFNHAKLYYPYSLQQIRGFPSYCPLASHVQGHVSLGRGSGFGLRSLQAAYAEFMERSHFYLNIQSDMRGKLHDCNSFLVADALYQMINQLKLTPNDAKDHEFHLTHVKNIFDDTNDFLPTVMFALSQFDRADRHYIPCIDSSGGAAHTSFEQAFHHSLLEFIERQAVIGSWLIRQFRYKIDPQVLLYAPQHQKLAKQLLKNGEIHVYDVCLSLPGYAVIILYFAKSRIDCVQYAIGMAAALTPQEAITKALNELWLDYGYLYWACRAIYDDKFFPRDKKKLIRHIDDNNVEKTQKIISYDLQAPCNIHAVEYNSLPHVHVDEALSLIYAISPNIFLYHCEDTRGDYHYTKIISPDFFVHMAVQETLNIDNQYIKYLSDDINDLYRQTLPIA